MKNKARYRLVSIDKWDRSQITTLMSGEYSLMFSRFNLFNKYMKHFKSCPRTKRQRALFQSIEKKLFKELHGQFHDKWLFDLMYGYYICILDTKTNQVLCTKRFRYTSGGLVPNDWETNELYLSESKQIKELTTNPWQDLHKRYSFKYYKYV